MRPKSVSVVTVEGDGNGLAQKMKKKKERATCPKLTLDLLLFDNGIGFMLLYIPKAFMHTDN
jgi:TIMELESS-interacting protein